MLEGLLARLITKRSAPKTPAPVAAKLDALDPRWDAKPAPAAKPAPTTPAPEKIDAFDDRWSSKPAAPVSAPVAAPVATPIAAAAAHWPATTEGRLRVLLERVVRARQVPR